MAHIATKRFNYWGQFGILLAFTGIGLIFATIATFIISISLGQDLASIILKPEAKDANNLRLIQFITTFFFFFIPAFFYAKLCHKKAFRHLGFIKIPSIKQLLLVLIIMICALFIVGALSTLWKQVPFPPYWQQKFKAAEEAYAAQMEVMARMNGIGDYILSMIIVALLPAVFEEMIFRGALQNLLSRWMKAPVWAIVITSIIFSAFHGSYEGFFPRLVLGFILGWMFYRTGNIWLNITAHFINNAIGITTLYFYSRPGRSTDLSKLDDSFPLWLGAVGVVAVIALLFVFDVVSKKEIDRPGKEVPLAGYTDPNNPFITEIDNIGNPNQS
jgi:membrane protease YdiL (CAAX protease family)